ncbi:MAG TPA: alpha/beta fold hydrolase [Propionibacteriaceae bacterium]|nr:alpha/beta fold hydrolase [Propionibacteriaceae bacterium]
MTLAVTRVGDGPVSYVFLHGLLGQGKNWSSIAKALQPACSLLVDLPNHGRSPRTDDVSYEAMADAVGELLAEAGGAPVTLVGHSMGGKVAMLVALRRPELVARLAVVDISPAERNAVEFVRYLDAMLAIDLSRIATRADADAQLRSAAPNPVVRAFLLQGLQRTDAGWEWRPNLEGLRRGIARIGAWPTVDGTYDGPVLWLGGDRSDYVSREHLPAMRALFPKVRLVVVKGAGHWVHADQPDVVAGTLRQWVSTTA